MGFPNSEIDADLSCDVYDHVQPIHCQTSSPVQEFSCPGSRKQIVESIYTWDPKLSDAGQRKQRQKTLSLKLFLANMGSLSFVLFHDVKTGMFLRSMIGASLMVSWPFFLGWVDARIGLLPSRSASPGFELDLREDPHVL